MTSSLRTMWCEHAIALSCGRPLPPAALVVVASLIKSPTRRSDPYFVSFVQGGGMTLQMTWVRPVSLVPRPLRLRSIRLPLRTYSVL